MRKAPRKFELEYKKRIVQEYLSGRSSTEIAATEGIRTGHIYRWKTELENLAREDRIEQISTDQGVSLEQARKIRELEEELQAAKEKIADQSMIIDLLKKIQPNFQSEKRSSGYIETKRKLGPKSGRVK